MESSLKIIGKLGLFTSTILWKNLYFNNILKELGEKEEEEIFEACKGIKILSRAIEVKINERSVTKILSANEIFDYILLDDKVNEIASESFGQEYKFYYIFCKYISINLHIFNFIKAYRDEHNVDFEDEEWEFYFSNFAMFIRKFSKDKGTLEIIDKEIFDSYNDLEDIVMELQQLGQDTTVLNKLVHTLDKISNIIFNDFPMYNQRLKRGRKLLEELKLCPPGHGDWRKYENICFKILREMFVPPFKKVIEQRSTESRDQRRDAVLPLNNHSYGDFWSVIKEEFNSKHIIVEFKNYKEPIKKDQLNQLRLYLSRPTIGRFGILINRFEFSKELLNARRRAFEESKILILLLDDEMLKELLYTYIYLGKAESYLEDLKTDFDLSY
ncbi:restriction endonuclease [Priestia megaterium]|uniref:restriction endonuclease n=1 Tax=Priestia megaterium TaxID=1404 RepID=UPI00234ECD4D|nr:restriction endonuclease [Priestia megaterium]MDC7783913.1 restriction endonuclease [Priestia megaterium]